MSRDATPYAEMRSNAVFAGQDVSKPEAGFFRHKLRGGGIAGGVRLWHGPPADPVTGELLDRSWRWQAEFEGQPVDFDDVWPNCVGDPVTEADYRAYCARRTWAAQNAPNSAFAKPGKRYDPLSSSEPLPF